MLALRPRTHAVDKHQLLVLDIEYQCIDWPLNRIDSPLAAVRALGSRVSSLNRFNLRHVRRHSASLTALDARFNSIADGDSGATALREAVQEREGFGLLMLNDD